MTDYLSIIRQPIERELGQFVNLFNSSLTHDGKLQEEIFTRIRNRAGKRMRPSRSITRAVPVMPYFWQTPASSRVS